MIASIVIEIVKDRAIAFVSSLLGTRTGRLLVYAAVAAAVLGALFVWHKIDKARAVSAAVQDKVDQFELTSLQVQLEEMKRRKAVADSANRDLQTRIEQADADAEAAAEELADYVSTVSDSCVVDADLFERLHNR